MHVRLSGAGATDRQFQIARSDVVVRLADEPLCSDGLASAPTNRCPSESTVQQTIGVLDRPTLPPALRIAKIAVDVGRNVKRRDP